MIRLDAFSRAWRRLHVFALSSDWFIALFTSVVIGQSNDFGFGLTTLNWKTLYSYLKVVNFYAIALFTVDFSHLHYNVIQRGCDAILGYNYKIARNCLTYMLDFIVMQMSRVNRERAIQL